MADQLADLAARVQVDAVQFPEPEQYAPTPIDGLGAVTSTRTTPISPTLYHPVICLILQGAKAVEFGDRRVECRTGQSIVVSHDLPIQSQITTATVQRPYVALILDLDVALLRRLADDLDDRDGGLPAVAADASEVALEVGTADPSLVDAFTRLYALTDTPTEAAVLAPLAVQEIHVRLLLAEHGAGLHRLLRRESHASRISKAIARLRDDLAAPISVPELARTVGMSPSSFHEHFKAVTATTPLQFQKELRLLESRRLLAAGDRTVTETALAVGYQSPTQFSREYSRKFGVAPRDDRDRPAAVAVA